MHWVGFYKYQKLKNVNGLRNVLLEKLQIYNVLGRVYIAEEGVNASLVAPKKYVEKVQKIVSRHIGENVFFNVESVGKDQIAFKSLKVKMKPKIVQDGRDMDMGREDGTREVLPMEWHKMLKNDRVDKMVLDIRNSNEHEIGHFRNGVNLHVRRFRDTFDAVRKLVHQVDKEKQILLYCTGCIRCEKVSQDLMLQGYKNVYRLKGGIVHYLNVYSGQDSLFVGKNFVFDQRMVQRDRVASNATSTCSGCDATSDQYTNCANKNCGLLVRLCDACYQQLQGACSHSCMQQLHVMEKKRAYEKKKQCILQQNELSTVKTLPASKLANRTFCTLSDRYAVEHSTESKYEDILSAIQTKTMAAWPRSHMLIEKSQANFLRFFIQAFQCTRILEIGCFTGYSALVMAESIPCHGTVHTCDINPNCIAFAKQNFQLHPCGGKVQAYCMDGLQFVDNLEIQQQVFDFIFIDANKKQYANYFNKILNSNVLASQGIIAFDNTLFKGRVYAEDLQKKETIASTMVSFNTMLQQDQRVETMLLPLWDGISFVRRK